MLFLEADLDKLLRRDGKLSDLPAQVPPNLFDPHFTGVLEDERSFVGLRLYGTLVGFSRSNAVTELSLYPQVSIETIVVTTVEFVVFRSIVCKHFLQAVGGTRVVRWRRVDVLFLRNRSVGLSV